MSVEGTREVPGILMGVCVPSVLRQKGIRQESQGFFILIHILFSCVSQSKCKQQAG